MQQIPCYLDNPTVGDPAAAALMAHARQLGRAFMSQMEAILPL
jgi:hypothetical protein